MASKTQKVTAFSPKNKIKLGRSSKKKSSIKTSKNYSKPYNGQGR